MIPFDVRGLAARALAAATLMMIAYAAEAGDQQLLKTHLDVLTRSAPNFIDSLFRGENQVFQRPEHMEMLLNGLRRAGFSE